MQYNYFGPQNNRVNPWDPNGTRTNTVQGNWLNYFTRDQIASLTGETALNNMATAGQQAGAGTVAPQAAQPLSPWEELQKKLDEANAANEARYQQLLSGSDAAKSEELGGLKTGYAEMLGLAGQGSAAAHAQEAKALQNSMGAAQQNAVSRGLGNTTILDSLQRGALNESQLRDQAITDAQTGRQLGVAQNYYNQLYGATTAANNRRLGFIENKTDQGPDLATYYQLLSRPGAYGVGAGGGGGGYTGVMGGRSGGQPQLFGGGYSRPAGPDATYNITNNKRLNPLVPEDQMKKLNRPTRFI